MPYELKQAKTLLLPGSEPRTAIVFEPMTEESYALFEAAVVRHNNAVRQTGRDPADGDTIRRISAMERDALSRAVREIQHARAVGVTLTYAEEIASYLADLPTQVYRHVKAEILQITVLSEIEVKA